MKKLFLVFPLLIMLLFSGVSFAKSPIVISDREHDSVRVHNRIVAFILAYGYGYNYEFLPTSNTIAMAGVLRGDIDINMECWIDNMQEAYDKCLSAGVQDLGSNFPDSWQGWLIPSYTAKKYNIKSVFDMNKHWKVFKDKENPKRGRFYSCIPGWFCSKINEKKMEAYELTKNYDVFLPGSGASLAGSLVAALKRHKPWFGYYWAPTWILGKYDMYKLEEPVYNKEKWENNWSCAYPSVRVNILVGSKFVKDYPDVVKFLKNYETTQEINNKFLAYQREIKGKNADAAIWFLENYRNLWTKWLPVDIAVKVEQALREGNKIEEK